MPTLTQPYLTECQFRHFKRLAALMDGGSIDAHETARRAIAHGIPWRALQPLTGLDDAQLDAAINA